MMPIPNEVDVAHLNEFDGGHGFVRENGTSYAHPAVAHPFAQGMKAPVKILHPAFRAHNPVNRAWLLARGDHILPIFGTRRPEHLDENAGAAAVRLEADLVARLDALISTRTVAGPRYNAATQSEIDTETFPWEDDT